MAIIINESANADGSYSALVQYCGMEFAVTYVNSEVRVHGSSRARSDKARQFGNTVKRQMQVRIASLGPEFQAAHKRLYSE